MSSGPTNGNETVDRRRDGGEAGAETLVQGRQRRALKAPGTALVSVAEQWLNCGGRMLDRMERNGGVSSSEAPAGKVYTGAPYPPSGVCSPRSWDLVCAAEKQVGLVSSNFCELVNDSVSARAKHRCTHQPEWPPAMSVTPRWPLATVHSGDVTVHSDRPEWTVTSPECTVASGQRGLTDMAGGHSVWQHCGWCTDWLSTPPSTQSTSSPNSAENISMFALSNCAKFQRIWQNSPYNTANSWRQIGDENHVIK